MHPALQAFGDVVVVNAPKIAHELSLKLRDEPEGQRRAVFAGSPESGYFYLYHRDDMHTDTVMECVVSTEGDAITSIYKTNRIFSAPTELIRARNVLISAIAEQVGLSAASVGIDDPARGRALGLKELSTGQLLDLLAERLGHTVLVTDSHVADTAALTVGADGVMSLS